MERNDIDWASEQAASEAWERQFHQKSPVIRSHYYDEWLKQKREEAALARLARQQESATLGPHTNPLRATQGFTEADKQRAVDEAQRIVMEGRTHG